MKGKRKNIEKKLLEPFKEIANNCNMSLYTRQCKDNRLMLEEKLYFQFGDLRVDTKDSHVVVEVESGGGITNLVKYWYCIRNKNQMIKKPILFLHIYMKSSKNDYSSHLILWKFIYSQMEKDLRDNSLGKTSIKAKLFSFEYGQEPSDALVYFKKAILGEKTIDNF